MVNLSGYELKTLVFSTTSRICKVSKEIIVSHCGYPRFDLLMTPLKTFFVFERTFEKKEKDNEFIEMSVSKIENFSKEERGGGGVGWG